MAGYNCARDAMFLRLPHPQREGLWYKFCYKTCCRWLFYLAALCSLKLPQREIQTSFFLGRGLLQFRIEPCDNVDIHSYGKNVEEITEQLAEIWRDSDITIPVPTAHHGLFLLLHHLSELHYTDEQTGRQTDTVTCTHSLYSQIINLETPN